MVHRETSVYGTTPSPVCVPYLSSLWSNHATYTPCRNGTTTRWVGANLRETGRFVVDRIRYGSSECQSNGMGNKVGRSIDRSMEEVRDALRTKPEGFPRGSSLERWIHPFLPLPLMNCVTQGTNGRTAQRATIHLVLVIGRAPCVMLMVHRRGMGPAWLCYENNQSINQPINQPENDTHSSMPQQ